MRVYEKAKALGISSKEVIAYLAKKGIAVTGHMAVLSPEALNALKLLEAQKAAAAAPAKKTLARFPRSRKGAKKAPTVERRDFRSSRETVVSEATVEMVSVEGEMTVGAVAELMHKKPNEIIFTLLKSGLVRNMNNILLPEEIVALGAKLGIEVFVEEKKEEELATQVSSCEGGEQRLPVVVVMGHVDHGKTTLLDFLRKTHVADKEKGGITQHLGAYEVAAGSDRLIFLDTPGHEAFTHMRTKGTRVTDIVVLIIAVNDGIKPQTIEALNLAKSAGVPIVVAINKIDKMRSPDGLDAIKTQLSNHDLTPEDWGGETVCVGISAKTGEGVDTLLEMIGLHAQMLDLKAFVDKPGEAFVLETKQVKGFGWVATVLSKNGTLRVGDYFMCGASTGKIRLLIDSFGKRVQSAGPSVPVQLVGFDTLVGQDDVLRVVTHKEYLEARAQKGHKKSFLHKNNLSNHAVHAAHGADTRAAVAENKISLILKTDTQGSCHALVQAIEKIAKQEKYASVPVEILGSEVGDISEGDVLRALDTGALLFGLHVKVERNATALAKTKNISIVQHHVIYHLVEEIEALMNEKRVREVRLVKTGEALVLKVFPLKGNGAIAGCSLKKGVLKKGDKVLCVRNGKEVGAGVVKSLQRDKKVVKEIREGQECGFMTDAFHDWQPDDHVDIFVEEVVED